MFLASWETSPKGRPLAMSTALMIDSTRRAFAGS